MAALFPVFADLPPTAQEYLEVQDNLEEGRALEQREVEVISHALALTEGQGCWSEGDLASVEFVRMILEAAMEKEAD